MGWWWKSSVRPFLESILHREILGIVLVLPLMSEDNSVVEILCKTFSGEHVAGRATTHSITSSINVKGRVGDGNPM